MINIFGSCNKTYIPFLLLNNVVMGMLQSEYICVLNFICHYFCYNYKVFKAQHIYSDRSIKIMSTNKLN